MPGGKLAHDTDLALARALLGGDEKTFNAFFEDYFPRLYRFALVRLESDEALAQDIAQTALMNGIRGLSGYRGEAAMFTWFCQIVRNEINAWYRKQARSVPVVPQDDDAIRPILESLEAEDAASPDARHNSLQVGRVIQEVLDHLPSNYGNALEWKYVEGFSVAEIAARLELTELATQSLLARARTAFRKAITQLSPQLVAQGE